MTTTATRPVDNGVNVEALLGAREALAQAPVPDAVRAALGELATAVAWRAA